MFKDVLYTHAAWIPSRTSNLVVIRNDGYLDIYDLLKNPARPYTQRQSSIKSRQQVETT